MAQLSCQPFVQPLAKSHGQLERPLVRRQNQNIPRRIQYRRTNLTMFQVPLNLLAQGGLDAPVDVLGNVLPYVLAIHFHRSLPKKPLRAGAAVFKYGTNRFCSINRARCSRTFTTPTLSPNASAVSWPSISSKSLSVN